MSKKVVKVVLTSAEIEEQTAAFLKSGGRVEYVATKLRPQVAAEQAGPSR